MEIDTSIEQLQSDFSTPEIHNEVEKLLEQKKVYETLKTENDRLAKQNLELFNRVTTSISPSTQTKDDDKEEKEEVTTDDILSYYS